MTLHPQDRATVALCLEAGLRRAEACALAWSDLQDGLITVRQGKGGKSRVVPVTWGTVRLLEAARVQGSPWVLSPRTRPAGSPLSCRALEVRVAQAGLAAGLGHVWPHKLRHTYATECLEAGLSIYEVQQLLGHASIMTTAIYLHTTPHRLAERYRALRDPAPGQLTLVA